ncbi:MAG: GNAT family N-acetyltransferase [Flavobacteriales bacterium]|nr:GNAT family N-acetyltransferase [Flavobacteriales bacterium]
MLQIIRTNAKHPDFTLLVKQLDSLLAIRDGKDHDFYQQFNGLEDIQYVLIAYLDQIPVACGAIKPYDEERVEIKRMFTSLKFRKQGIAKDVLLALEEWTVELSFQKCILETGTKLPEAVALYYKCGYQSISNYGQYEGIETSVCFEKNLISILK